MSYQITDNDVRVLRELLQWKRGFSGDGLTNAPQSASFGTSGTRRRHRRPKRHRLPTPQYQGMFYGGVAANQAGFMFIEALGDLPT